MLCLPFTFCCLLDHIVVLPPAVGSSAMILIIRLKTHPACKIITTIMKCLMEELSYFLYRCATFMFHYFFVYFQ